MQIHGPERLADQGLGLEQEESGNRAIAAMLADAEVVDQMDLVLTWRAGRDGEDPVRGDHASIETWLSYQYLSDVLKTLLEMTIRNRLISSRSSIIAIRSSIVMSCTPLRLGSPLPCSSYLC